MSFAALSATLSSRHRRTLEQLAMEPAPKSLAFSDIEALFVALGCTTREARGSGVTFRRDDVRQAFHRPHPGREAKSYQVRLAREFLERLHAEPPS